MRIFLLKARDIPVDRLGVSGRRFRADMLLRGLAQNFHWITAILCDGPNFCSLLDNDLRESV